MLSFLTFFLFVLELSGNSYKLSAAAENEIRSKYAWGQIMGSGKGRASTLKPSHVQGLIYRAC